MEIIAKFDGEKEEFNFNMAKLNEAGIELNVLRYKEFYNAASEIALDLLVLKALKTYFREEKVVSLNAADLYLGALEKSSKLVGRIREKGYFLPHPINPDKFSQEDILYFYQNKGFNTLLGMMAYSEREYFKKFKKNK